jgi:hypothetical protein
MIEIMLLSILVIANFVQVVDTMRLNKLIRAQLEAERLRNLERDFNELDAKMRANLEVENAPGWGFFHN